MFDFPQRATEVRSPKDQYERFRHREHWSLESDIGHFGSKSTNIGRIDIAHFRLYPYKFIWAVAERNCLGSFGSMKEDEKRNYLARKELQNYLVSIAREQLQVLLDTNQDATVACFECCRASKELTVDKHFKKIAFCG